MTYRLFYIVVKFIILSLPSNSQYEKTTVKLGRDLCKKFKEVTR